MAEVSARNSLEARRRLEEESHFRALKRRERFMREQDPELAAAYTRRIAFIERSGFSRLSARRPVAATETPALVLARAIRSFGRARRQSTRTLATSARSPGRSADDDPHESDDIAPGAAA